MVFVLILALVGSSLLLFLSIYPGVLSDFAFLAIMTSCLWLPVLCIGVVVFLIRLTSKSGQEKATKPGDDPPDEFAGVAELLAIHRRRMAIFLAVLILNLALFVSGVPRRLVFAASRQAFESLLASARAPARPGRDLNLRLGVYQVDRIEADPRGGVYFRTYTGSDGIGPDMMSYGFAYRPNPTGTPFGRAGYACSHLFGQWYSFEASNDY